MHLVFCHFVEHFSCHEAFYSVKIPSFETKVYYFYKIASLRHAEVNAVYEVHERGDVQQVDIHGNKLTKRQNNCYCQTRYVKPGPLFLRVQPCYLQNIFFHFPKFAENWLHLLHKICFDRLIRENDWLLILLMLTKRNNSKWSN